jgi:hypothetical protein
MTWQAVVGSIIGGIVGAAMINLTVVWLARRRR